MKDIEDLIENISFIEDEIFFTHISLGDSWLFTDEYIELSDLLESMYFELELLELLNSNYIKN